MRHRQNADLCPVSDGLLGRLYRASPEGLAALVRTVPPRVRAGLAVYCSRRAELTSLGIVIAASCTEQDLLGEAGEVGRALFWKASRRERTHSWNSASNPCREQLQRRRS